MNNYSSITESEMLAATVEIFERGLNPGIVLAILLMLWTIAILQPLMLLPDKKQEAISPEGISPLAAFCPQCTHVVTGANATATLEMHILVRHKVCPTKGCIQKLRPPNFISHAPYPCVHDAINRYVEQRDEHSPGFRQLVNEVARFK